MGSERDRAHRTWYRLLARYYDEIAERNRSAEAAASFLDARFRRHGGIDDILDVACGTFAIDIHLIRRGYRVAGRDRSPDMLRVASQAMRHAGVRASLGMGDMRNLDLGRTFDAVVCLGTAFNYLATPADVRDGLRVFRRHVRPGGLLVLDATNFDSWIRNPMNVRAEVDHRAPDGMRIAIFAFNAQDRRRRLHYARFITALERRGRVDLAWSEAPLRIWDRRGLDAALRRSGFRPAEWWGDLRSGARYRPSSSPRLVSLSEREA